MDNEAMTHAGQIFKAAVLVSRRNRGMFTREQVRQQISVSQDKWMSGYTAIFQGMRDDQPGGAPDPGTMFRNVFHRVGHGIYQFSKDGEELASELGT